MAASLPVIQTLKHAVAFSWLRRHALLQAALAPLVLLAVLDQVMVGRGQTPDVWANMAILMPYLAVQAFLTTAVAARCHRITLLGVDAPELLALPGLWELKVFGRVMLAALAIFVPLVLLLSVVSIAFTAFAALFQLVAIFVMIYVGARIGMIVPAASVDDDASLLGVYGLSENNGWRLVALILLPALAAIPILAPVGMLLEPDSRLALGINSAFQLVAVPVYAVIASFAYRHLRSGSDVEGPPAAD